MKISVIIAAYKGEKLIAEQLASLALQTRPPDEVLVGDDSGADNKTSAAVEEFRNSRTLPFELKYYHNPEQLGINENFHTLAMRASGDVIFFCDQDDVWMPEKIKRLSDTLANDPDADAVCCFSVLTDGQLTPWLQQDDSELAFARNYKGRKENLFSLFVSHKICGAGHNIAVRKSMLEQQPIWGPRLFYDFWILQSSAAAEKLLLVPERLTFHRIHGKNRTLSEDTYVGSNLMKRFKSINRQQDKNYEFSRLLKERVSFLKNLESSPLAAQIPRKNMELLHFATRYLLHRLALRKKNFFCRLMPPPSLIRGYFLCGNKWRSWLRDLAGK